MRKLLLSAIALAQIFVLPTVVFGQFAGPAGVSSGIVLWLDGSNVNNTAPATNPANGTGITTWKDISGHGNDATVLAGQNTPTLNTSQINGHDVVKFTRSSNVLGTVYNVAGVDIRATSLPQVTILTVYRQGTNTATDWHGVWGDDNGGWDRFFIPRFGSDNGVVSVGPPTNNVPVTNSGTVGSTKLLTVVYDYGVTNGSTVYFNGTPVQSVTDNTNTTAAQTTFRIGWDGDDNPFNGDIAEVIVYNRKLTDCEIQAINRYLGLKFGVSITTASITPASKAYFCPAGSVTLTANSGGASYQWLQNGAVIPSATSSTYNATSYGNYQVVVGNGSCFDTSAVTTVYQSGPTLYVDSSAASSGSGLSWASPLKTVAEALEIANNTSCNVQIWVKKGTYYPMAGTTIATSRDSSLRIVRNNIKLYGGFAGTETLLAQRNVTGNVTTLSGDIGVANDSTDNSYHVMTIVGNVGNTIDSGTIVDGFTITRGKAENTGTFTVNGMAVYRGAGGGVNTAGLGAGAKSSPLLENITFTRNSAEWGGGLYGQGHTSGTSSPMVRSCTFTANRAASYGGAVHFYSDGTSGTVSPNFVYCTFIGNLGSVQGGGGWFDGASPSVSSPVFTQCSFTSNATDPVNDGGHYGGALTFFGATSTPTITGSTFTNNTSSFGGAVASAGPLQMLTIANSAFTGNSCFNGGGGIVMQNGGLNVSNTSFTACKGNTGGGIALLGAVPSTITNCDFTNDSVNFYGAAISNSTSQTSVITSCHFINTYGAVVGAIDNPGGGITTITKCIFSGNKTGQIGGIMNNYSGTVTFNNCLITNNSTTTASGTGGGTVHMQTGTTTTFNNCTLYENTTASTSIPNSNAFSVDAGATVNVNNTIVWGAIANQVANSGTITYSYSDVQGVAAAGTNLSKNPKFVNAADPDGTDNTWGTTDDGLTLSQCSPLINAGSNALIPVGLTTDLASATRVQNTTVDMGAYESALNNIVVVPSVSIAANPSSTICAGTSVTFTGTPANGGTTPAYQWLLNGANVGTATSTYTNAVLTNGNTVQLRMISSATCPDPDTVYSNTITMTVNPVPAITGASPTNPTCAMNDGTITITGLTTGSSYVINYSKGGTPQTPVTQTASGGTVTITGLTSGSYTNISVTLGSCTSNTIAGPFVLTAPTLPAVTIQPGNTSTCQGSNASFSVSGTGTGISYQWQVDNGGGFVNLTNTAPYSNVTGQTLLISGAAASLNGYFYRAVVSGTCSPAAISNSAKLTVLPPPSVTTQPTSTSVCQGANTSFTVSGTGPAPGVTYQWQVDNGTGFVNLTNNATYGNVTSSTLLITAAPTSINGYQYRAMVIGLCSPAATSSAATLTVIPTPLVTTAPANTSVCPGGTANFSVTATGSGLTYQWQVFNGTTLSNVTNTGVYSGATTSTLTITGATPAMTGYTYRVIVAGTCSPSAISSAATLTLYTPPVVLSSSSDRTICENGNTTFTVNAGGTGISYQWQVDNGAGFTNLANSTPYSGVTTAALTITGAPLPLNGGKYRAVITGTCTPPAFSIPANLTVLQLPAITGQSTITNVCPGSDIIFNVNAVGASLSYQWQVNTGSGFANLTNSALYAGVTTPSLRIIKPTIPMTGFQYRAIVSGYCAPPAVSSVLTLNVYNISIASQMMTDTACEGWTTQIGLRAAGGGLLYQWQVKTPTGYADLHNIPPYSGVNTDSLRISDIPGNLNGSIYRCVVKETVLCNITFYSADIPLTVNQAPVSAPAKVVVPSFGSATFTVPAGASSYQWQENRSDGGGFIDLTESTMYNGVATNALTVRPITIDMDAFQYRCIVKGLCFNPLTSTASTVKVDQGLSVKNTSVNGTNYITVYPNPLSGSELNISFEKPVKGNTSIVVFDKLGQVVYTGSLDLSQNKGSIDLRHLAAGVYTLQVTNEAEQINTSILFTKQ